MYDLLKGLTVVEGSSFVAAPLCGLTFAQLGAEVIRFDQIGGGLDFGRWPLATNGRSLYWEGLNKGKKSVAIDLGRPEGRELACALITAPGENAGLFVTNFPAGGFLAHDKLAARRPDLITLRVTGSSDASSALDYTINSAAGYPLITGPVDAKGPVNHVLPAWDISCGLTAAVTLLAAERARRLGGHGQEIRLALSDVAFSMLGHLGQIGEVLVNHQERERIGNALYGAFGRDFATRDGRSVMICAITRKQWNGLLEAFGLTAAVDALASRLGVDFGADEGARFIHREALFAIVEPAIAQIDYATCAGKLDEHGVCWGPYRTVTEALAEDKRLSLDNPMFSMVSHPSGATYLTPGYPAALSVTPRQPARSAPDLGQHTEEVLADRMKLSAAEIGRLHDAGVVASPRRA
ncbi:MAG: CoA transferase [Burkholderiaceae bacterium]